MYVGMAGCSAGVAIVALLVHGPVGLIAVSATGAAIWGGIAGVWLSRAD